MSLVIPLSLRRKIDEIYAAIQTTEFKQPSVTFSIESYLDRITYDGKDVVARKKIQYSSRLETNMNQALMERLLTS